MFKHKWLYVLYILCVGICTISLLARHDVEQQFHKVEMAVPYYELVTANAGNDQSLKQLLDQGATTVVLKPSTIDELQQRAILRYYSVDKAPPELALTSPQPNQSIVLFESMRPEERDYYASWLQSALHDKIEFVHPPAGQSYMIISEPAARLGSIPLGIDVRLAANIVEQYQVELVPLYMNNPLYLNPAFMEQQLQSLHDLQVHHLYFGGNEVLGYPQALSDTAHLLTQYDMHFTLIRSQLGAKQLAEWMDYDLLRVIFVEPDKLMSLSTKQLNDIFELSVRERTISMIYYPFPKEASAYGLQQYVERVDASIVGMKERLAPDYEWTTAVPLSELVEDNRTSYVISAFLGIVLAVLLLLRRYTTNYWMMGSVITVAVITIVLWYAGYPSSRLIQNAYGLLGAIVVPTLAVITGHEVAQWIRSLHTHGHNDPIKRTVPLLIRACLLYGLVAGFTLSGVVLVVALFNDISFLTYVDQFRGVKLMLIGPIVLTFLYLWRTGDVKSFASYVYRIAVTQRDVKKLITIIIVLGIVGLIGVYFVLRAGNEGMTLPFESEFRQWMNSFFGVRPRTKEMWIGHPLLLLALYVCLRYGNGRWLLLGAVIGQLSIMNTFTHLHSPLAISFTRTWIGLTAGLIIGIVLTVVIQRILTYTEYVRGSQHE